MTISKRSISGAAVCALAWCVAEACSPKAGPDSLGNGVELTPGGGGNSGTFGDASFMPPPSNTAGTGAGGPFVVGSQDAGRGGYGFDGPPCSAVKQVPETITVYRDATVTDTITTYKPVALFIMQDRSSSMWTGRPSPASPESWRNSTNAVRAFVNDPASQGIDVGLGVFPPMNPIDSQNQGDCAAGSDCGTPLVPIAALPGNAQPIISGYTTADPTNIDGNNTPTECALRGMINTCLRFQSTSVTGEQCVAVLVTDGTPTRCSTNQQTLIGIVQQGHDLGVTTYVLGLPGADINFLNQVANVGGTSAAIDVTGGSQSFIAALNNIRQAVSVQTTTQVSTPVVVSTPLPCKWGVPTPPAGQTFDPSKVNVQFTPPGGAPVKFGHVTSAAACDQTTQDAWYYDDENNPTEVLACPNACRGTLHNSAGAQVELLFGCATEPAGIH
jgi:hypothetical protein